MNTVRTVAELEALLGRPHPTIASKKVIPADKWTEAFIASSTSVWWASDDLRLAVGSTRGLTLGCLDDAVRVPFGVPVGSPVGSLWMAHAHFETLRLNGTMIDQGLLRISEQFLHCSKALRRGEVWTHAVPPTAALATFRFAVVATCGGGTVDVSPRGDDPTVLHQVATDEYLLIDRPGNRLGDAFHNLLADASIEVALFGAGAPGALVLRGRAEVVSGVRAANPPSSGTGLALHIHVRERDTVALPADMWTSHATAPPTMAHVVSARSAGKTTADAIQRELDHDVEARLW
jgi:hypothetical protein